MALCPYLITRSLLDEPFSALKIFDTEPAFSYAKDVNAVANTRIDWKETDDAHIISADLPGLTKEDVKIELLDSSTVRISGERRKEEVKETDKWHRVERASGKFLRSFRLPDNIDKGSINAKFDNGVLVLNLPKVKAKALEVKPIEIAGDEAPAAA